VTAAVGRERFCRRQVFDGSWIGQGVGGGDGGDGGDGGGDVRWCRSLRSHNECT